MKANSDLSKDNGTLDALKSDCRHWRELVSQCVHTDNLMPPSIEEQYRAVHNRILGACRNVVDQKSVPETGRRAVLKLDELLRPWSSTQIVKGASPKLVNDLLNNETNIESQLEGEDRNYLDGRKLALTACLAGIAGFFLVVFVQWAAEGFQFVAQSFDGLMTSIAVYLERTSFTELFAVAVLCTWLFGTWLLSRLSSN